jgi:hypothetical protein
VQAKNTSSAPSKPAPAKSSKPRKRGGEPPMTGAPCVNCNQYMGTHEPAFTAPGFAGRSHEICIRNKAMPYLVKRACAIIEACERKEMESHGKPFDREHSAHAFRAMTTPDRLRKMQPSELARLLTAKLTTLYGRCTNGLSGMQPQIVEFALQARRRLFCEVTVVPSESPDVGVVGKASARGKRVAK